MKKLSLLLVSLLFISCSSSGPNNEGTDFDNDDGSSLLLFSKMDSTEDIINPTFATATYADEADAVPGLDHMSVESGEYDQAIQFSSTGDDAYVNGHARFHGDNFDLSDPDSDGGRLDFWMKYNQDVYHSPDNTWFMRANWIHSEEEDISTRPFDVEYIPSSPTAAMLQIFVRSFTPTSVRTNYSEFLVSARSHSAFADQEIQTGEWFQVTILWRRNGAPHKAELHIFINGSQEGCNGCSDYNGNLPEEGVITDLFLSPALPQNNGSGYRHAQFSLDEIYSFEGWDTTGITGNYAQLDRPEGVTLTFPVPSGGPEYGCKVEENPISFEFFAINKTNETFTCDLYLDENLIGSKETTSEAHTAIVHGASVAAGTHTYQVKCDGDNLDSGLDEFTVGTNDPDCECGRWNSEICPK